MDDPNLPRAQNFLRLKAREEFFGKVVLTFAAGHVVMIHVEQHYKPEELDGVA